MIGKTGNSSSAITELKRLVNALPKEKQRRIFYVLDYILNYFTGERRIPKLNELNFWDEVNQLKKLGLIKERSLYWRGYRYNRLQINYDVVNDVKNLLKERYYPSFDESAVEEKIRNIIKDSLSPATKLWHIAKEFDGVQYTLSG